MALKLIIEVRHPQGKPDLLCPVLYCDVCGERMAGKKGGYIDVFTHAPPPTGTPEYREFCDGKKPVDIYTVHGGSCLDYAEEHLDCMGFMPITHMLVNLAANEGLAKNRKEWSKMWKEVVDFPVF
jgi:hypothetical protein